MPSAINSLCQFGEHSFATLEPASPLLATRRFAGVQIETARFETARFETPRFETTRFETAWGRHENRGSARKGEREGKPGIATSHPVTPTCCPSNLASSSHEMVSPVVVKSSVDRGRVSSSGVCRPRPRGNFRKQEERCHEEGNSGENEQGRTV